MYGTPSFLRRKWVRETGSKYLPGSASAIGGCTGAAVFIGHKKTELDGAHAVGMKTIAFKF